MPTKIVAPSYRSFMRTWIPVSKAMPDSDATVLVCSPDADEPVWLGFHDGLDWRWVSGETVPAKVTHWAEMPEPPLLKTK